MSAERASELASDATLKARDPDLEDAVWLDLLYQLHTLTPRIESIRPGSALVEPADEDGLNVFAETNGAQGALAPTRPLARLGAIRAAVGHLLRIKPADVKGFLSGFDTGHLVHLGFSEDVAERLVLFGYDQLWKARSLSKKHLADQFGEPGARLYQLLHAAGEDRVAPFSPPPLVEDEYLFDWPTSDAGAIYSAAEYVTERLIARLERRQAQRIEIEIDVRHAGAPLIQGRTLPEATAGHQTVMRIVRKQLEALLEPDHEVVSFTMRLGALRHPDHQQGTLFQTKPGVKKALDAVRRRHPGALLRARVNPHAVFEEDECVLEAFDESQ